MRQYNCIVVDDERPALKLLAAYIEKIPHLNLVATCENAFDALSALQENEVDILFLDIQMPDLTGIELLKTLNQRPYVIMTTAYREYAVEGFEMDVTDYLIKPFSFSRFVQAVNKVTDLEKLKSIANSKNPLHSSQTESDNDNNENLDKVLYLKSTHKIDRVDINDILYVESMREYISVYTTNNRYVLHKSMNKMCEELPSMLFERVHRSHIVNMKHITSISGNTIKINQKTITIGGSYKKAFFERINLLS